MQDVTNMNRIATIGFFDGVHRGHRFLIDHLLFEAQKYGLQPLIVTFMQHPREVLQSDYVPQLLTSTEQRLALLQSISPVEAYNFAEIKDLTAEQFMRRLHNEKGVKMLLMGYDHLFGSDCLKHIQDYRKAGEKAGVKVVQLPEYVDGEWHISSTEIRQALQNGNILVANELLGRPYSISGIVIEGNHIGHSIGFPTANIRPDTPHQLLPKCGVYAVTLAPPYSMHPAICNIGSNPTVGNNEITIEVHIPSIDADLYGKCLTIHFERFLREEHKFDSLLDLRHQILVDLSRL